MKKIAVILFILLGLRAFSQQGIYQQVMSKLSEQTGVTVQTNQKILALCAYNGNDELVKEIEKTFTVYEHSKLKGGSKGFLAVMVVENAEQKIKLEKLGYKKTIKLLRSDLENFNSEKFDNLFFDSSGSLIMRDKKESEFFKSVQGLITR